MSKPEVVHDFPPNVEKIATVLGYAMSTHGVVFAYDGKIYFPQGADGETILPEDIFVHEAVHHRQQDEFGNVEAWWDEYLADIRFRLDQELEAYRAQLAYIDEHHNRDSRRWYEKELAKQLSSSRYGNILSQKKALKALRAIPLDK